MRFGVAGRPLALVLGASLLAGLGACSATPTPAQGAGSWTILSYSIADTDLEPYMMDDVEELGTVGTSDDLSIVALVDRAADYSDQDVLGLGDWVGGKLIEVGQGQATELEDLGDVDTGDPALLAEFIERGVEEYPADNYALVISDHGASWPGVGGDESAGGNGLDLAEISQGIEAGIAGAGIEKLDLIGFDACLMATFEVAREMAPFADRMLASQELEPGHGWNYEVLDFIQESGGATVDEVGTALIEGFEQQAIDQETQAEITLSLVDLTAMSTVDAAVSAFSDALVERAATVAPTVGRTLAETLGFGRNTDPTSDSHMTDLGILASEIGVDALDVSDQADGVIRAINDAVIAKVDGQATRGATGLSIYFPPTSEYFKTDYSAIGTNDSWLSFLESYYSVGEAIADDDQASFDEDSASVSFDDEGVNIEADFGTAGSDNLAEAYVRYGAVEDDGSITYYGREDVDFDGTAAFGSWDLTTLELSDGEDTVSGYVDLSVDLDNDIVTIDVPMGYYSADDVNGETYTKAQLRLLIEGGELGSETYYTFDPDTGMYGELSTEPEGIIAPELLNIAEDGTEEWFATSDYGLYADLPSLTYDFVEVPAGTELYIELVAIDYGGNEASVFAYVTAP